MASDLTLVTPLPTSQGAYQWSVDMAASLESGVLLRHDSTGHPAYFTSACVADTVNRYLLDLTLPAPDLVCDPGNGLFDQAG